MAKKSDSAATGEARERDYRVRLDDEIGVKADIIAAALKMSLPDYVNARMRPIVDEEVRRVLRDLGLTEK